MSRFAYVLIAAVVALLIGLILLVVYRKACWNGAKKTWAFLTRKGKDVQNKVKTVVKGDEKKAKQMKHDGVLIHKLEKELGRKMTNEEVVFAATLANHIK
jgi:Tfp pilus assembly protein PilN